MYEQSYWFAGKPVSCRCLINSYMYTHAYSAYFSFLVIANWASDRGQSICKYVLLRWEILFEVDCQCLFGRSNRAYFVVHVFPQQVNAIGDHVEKHKEYQRKEGYQRRSARLCPVQYRVDVWITHPKTKILDFKFYGNSYYSATFLV